MKLRLELKNPSSFPGTQSQWVMQGTSMIIGRAEQADWVLPDSERFISKQHCRIEWNGDRFVIVDMSVNGLKMNGLPINRGLPQPLDGGSILQIGKAIIEVTIETTGQAPGGRIAAPAAPAPSGGPLIPQGFIPSAATSVADPAPQPFPAPLAPVAPPAPVTPLVSAPVPMVPVAVSPVAFSVDGPFGSPQPMPVSSAQVLPGEPAPPTGAVLENWWNPEAKPVTGPAVAPPAPAEAGPASAPANNPEFVSRPEVIPGQAPRTMLLQKSGDIDSVQLAVLVETAAQFLPQEQRNEFLKRLDELIKEAVG